MGKFNPDWEIDYLYERSRYHYCVIKRPEPIMGDKILMVREGCTVWETGAWYYWQLKKPMVYKNWLNGSAAGVITGEWSDSLKTTPDKVVAARLNKGVVGVIPAPIFKRRDDFSEDYNNWIDNDNDDPKNPVIVPDYVPDDMLGDLTIAHLQLCDELLEGKPLPKVA